MRTQLSSCQNLELPNKRSKKERLKREIILLFFERAKIKNLSKKKKKARVKFLQWTLGHYGTGKNRFFFFLPISFIIRIFVFFSFWMILFPECHFFPKSVRLMRTIAWGVKCSRRKVKYLLRFSWVGFIFASWHLASCPLFLSAEIDRRRAARASPSAVSSVHSVIRETISLFVLLFLT